MKGVRAEPNDPEIHSGGEGAPPTGCVQVGGVCMTWEVYQNLCKNRHLNGVYQTTSQQVVLADN